MENGKSLLVVNAIVNKENMNLLGEYQGSIMQVFGKNGGKPVARYKTSIPLAGDESPEMIAIAEFESPEVIQNMVNGEDFQALSELRSKVFSKLNLMICESL